MENWSQTHATYPAWSPNATRLQNPVVLKCNKNLKRGSYSNVTLSFPFTRNIKNTKGLRKKCGLLLQVGFGNRIWEPTSPKSPVTAALAHKSPLDAHKAKQMFPVVVNVSTSSRGQSQPEHSHTASFDVKAQSLAKQLLVNTAADK
eukprot:scaffold136661_cov20-Tisochrysis_lutea.AAC.4